MPSANCQKKLGASGIKNGGANCRILCGKSYFLPKLQNRPRFTHFLFLIMGALLEKKKKKKNRKKKLKEKKSKKKENPQNFIVEKEKKNAFWTQEGC